MSRRSPKGMTWLEILVLVVVALAVLFLVVMLSLPTITVGPHGSNAARQISNFRQLQLATQQMAIDGITTENRDLGWPGDTGGTFTNWTTRLVEGGYLRKEDLCKLLSAPGIVVTQIPETNNTAVFVYAVKESSPEQAVFLSTANFLYTPEVQRLDQKAKPYGGKGSVIMQKDGNGRMFHPKHLTDTNHIGVPMPLLQ